MNKNAFFMTKADLLNAKLNDILDAYCQDDIDDIMESIINGEDDFKAGDYRYIKQSEIDKIMIQEFRDNSELLGYFEPYFISDALPGNIDPDIIEKLQKAGEHYFGEFLAEIPDYIENITKLYVQTDGYGHHFSTYDFSQNEITMPNGVDYYIFRIE